MAVLGHIGQFQFQHYSLRGEPTKTSDMVGKRIAAMNCTYGSILLVARSKIYRLNSLIDKGIYCC